MTENSNFSDVIILGSGPAGCSAAIYASRAGLKTTMIAGNQPGGQLTVTTDVENYPGFAHTIQGPWLVEEMRKQCDAVGVESVFDHIASVTKNHNKFSLKSQLEVEYSCSAVIAATGASAKWLGIPDEEKYRGYGVSGCATCDGFFFKGKDVMVIGGGNTAVEEALYLTNHASKVFLVHRRDTLRAEKVLQDRLFSNKKIEIIWDNTLENIIGTEAPKAVEAAVLKSTKDATLKEIAVKGIFIAIGHSPNTGLFKNLVEMDSEGYILTQPGRTFTNVNGLFACGDVQDKIYRQAVTAAGTGCMAALDAANYVKFEIDSINRA